MVKVANKEPLWYGKGDEATFQYEQSDWHQHLAHSHHQRSSDEGTLPSNESPQSNEIATAMEEKQTI